MDSDVGELPRGRRRTAPVSSSCPTSSRFSCYGRKVAEEPSWWPDEGVVPPARTESRCPRRAEAGCSNAGRDGSHRRRASRYEQCRSTRHRSHGPRNTRSHFATSSLYVTDVASPRRSLIGAATPMQPHSERHAPHGGTEGRVRANSADQCDAPRETRGDCRPRRPPPRSARHSPPASGTGCWRTRRSKRTKT